MSIIDGFDYGGNSNPYAHLGNRALGNANAMLEPDFQRQTANQANRIENKKKLLLIKKSK